MGEFNTVGLEDIIDAFSRREAATVEAVPKMLKAGADVLIEAQRAEAQAMGLNETGGFINSIKATDVKGDDTEKYVEIYPQGRAKHGNDRKGDKSKVRYATIGFVAEYGTSSHAARPYMTVANENGSNTHYGNMGACACRYLRRQGRNKDTDAEHHRPAV